MTAEVPVLEAHDLRVRLGRGGRGVAVIEGLSLAVLPGETLAIYGVPGSGKTTAMLALAGLLPLQAGTVTVAGEPRPPRLGHTVARWRTRHFGLVFSTPKLFGRIAAIENVAMPLRLLKLDARRRRAQALRALEYCRAAALAGQRARSLSALEARLVAFARAIATDPTLLVLDDPTAGLRAADRRWYVPRIVELARHLHKPVIWFTGDPEVAAEVPRRLTLLDGHLTQPDDNGAGAGPVGSSPAATRLAATSS